MAGRMFPNCGVDHGKLDSWSILVFPAEIMGKRELHTEGSFVLFFKIGCLRWSEAGGD